MAELSIPTVDLSPFLREGDEDGKNKAMEIIVKACSDYGFFKIVNHGVPVDLMTKALELSRMFFDYSVDEKRKWSPKPDAPIPAGYTSPPPHSPDKTEVVLMLPPDSSFNVYPENPPEFRETVIEVFSYLAKTALVIESILNQCLGLPTNFLKEFNNDRNYDFFTAFRYFPATENENNGLTPHEDGNCITFVFQDEAGGLEVRRNGEWIPASGAPGTIVVNVGDVIQVLSNNKFKSATHRVVRPKGKSRYSYAFFHNLHEDKWVEPLPQFTTHIGEPPKYRGFLYKDYQQLRLRNKFHPPSSPEDEIGITHYAITTNAS